MNSRPNHFFPFYVSSNFIMSILSLFFLANCSKDDFKPTVHDYSDYEFEEPTVTGNTYYIDPVNGSSEGNGSITNPWRTLQEVIESDLICYYRHTENNNPESSLEIVNENAPVKGGDRIILKSGYHGYVSRNNFIFNEWLTIEGEGNAVLSQFRLEGAFAKVYLKKVTISKESYIGTENFWEADVINRNNNACVYLASSDFWGKGSDIKLKDLTLRTVLNSDPIRPRTLPRPCARPRRCRSAGDSRPQPCRHAPAVVSG